MQKITPFLWFDNNAEEAAQFYTSVFKNSNILSISRYGDAGPGPKGSVMVVSFQLEGQQFTALNGGPLFKFSAAFSFVVSCENQEEIDYYWTKLTTGAGQESQCGWRNDNVTLRAPTFSSTYLRCLVPGIGTISSPLASSQASAS